MDWAAVKLVPQHTGLPTSIWITQKESETVITIRVELNSSTDFALVSRWVDLNRQTIIDFWDDTIGAFDLVTRLIKL